MTNRDFYKILGVHPEASDEEIKSAYRELARIHHPDASLSSSKPADPEYFKAITEAYAALTNPEKRKAYDYSLGSRNPGSSMSWLKKKSEEIFYPIRRGRSASAWKMKQEKEKKIDEQSRLVLISVLGALVGIFCALLVYALLKLLF